MYQVKVFDGKGKLKKLITHEDLVKREWVKEDKRMLFGAGQHKPTSKIRKNKGKGKIKKPTFVKWEQVERQCALETCGKTFLATVKKNIYCTRECSWKGQRKYKSEGTKTCIMCKNEFEAEWPRLKFCGVPCDHRLFRRDQLNKNTVSRLKSACRPHKSGDMLA